MYASPFIDETFDIYNCNNYTLSIQCALDGFSFSVLDNTVNKFIVFSELELNTATPFELKNELLAMVSSEPILQRNYKSVKVAFISNQTTLMPRSLFSKTEKETFFNLSFEKNREDIVMESTVGNESVLLFPLPNVISTLFTELFPNVSFVSPLSFLFKRIEQSALNQKSVLVYSFQYTLFVLATNGRNIQFLNSFFVKTDTDCLYYILNSIKQINGDSKTQVEVFGKVDFKTNLMVSLKKYFESVNTATFSPKYAVSYTFHKEPEHYHIPTLEMALCE